MVKVDEDTLGWTKKNNFFHAKHYYFNSNYFLNNLL